MPTFAIPSATADATRSTDARPSRRRRPARGAAGSGTRSRSPRRGTALASDPSSNTSAGGEQLRRDHAHRRVEALRDVRRRDVLAASMRIGRGGTSRSTAARRPRGTPPPRGAPARSRDGRRAGSRSWRSRASRTISDRGTSRDAHAGAAPGLPCGSRPCRAGRSRTPPASRRLHALEYDGRPAATVVHRAIAVASRLLENVCRPRGGDGRGRRRPLRRAPRIRTDLRSRSRVEAGSLAGFVTDVDDHGNRMNPNELLLDPYALEVSHDPGQGSGARDARSTCARSASPSSNSCRSTRSERPHARRGRRRLLGLLGATRRCRSSRRIVAAPPIDAS